MTVASGMTTKLEKAQLEIYEPSASGQERKPGAKLATLRFHFNPKEYAISLDAGWTFKPAKSRPETPEFTGNQPRSLSVDLLLDATDQDSGDVSKDVDLLFSCLSATQTSIDNDAPFPPLVILVWGVAPPFVGVVKSVNASFTLFRPDGRPVRATAKLALQEYGGTPPRQNPTSGSLRARRSHQVVLGDSLASISTSEYGTPVLWRALARTNGIIDPRQLRPGMELLVPSPAEARALA